MNDGMKECRFLWTIENYSYCWHKTGQPLVSPGFTPDGLEGTSWNLQLYPRGEIPRENEMIVLYLARSEHDSGEEDFPLLCRLSFLAADGSTIYSTKNTAPTIASTFQRGMAIRQLTMMNDVLLQRKSGYLPQDTLSVLCEMWKGEENNLQITQISVRTRIRIEKLSFLHLVENYSELEPHQLNYVFIQHPSKSGRILFSKLYFVYDSCNEGEVIVENKSHPPTENHILMKQKCTLLDITGNVIACSEVDNRCDANRKDILKMQLPISLFQKDRSKYLPDNNFTLLCECLYSTGVELENTDHVQHQLSVMALHQSKSMSGKYEYTAARKPAACTSASEDMTALYIDQCMTDVTLKTKTKEFSAHKCVLCARSSVFKAMLTNDMSEKNTNCINVDDMEDDIVQQFLLFLYSDNLENLQWESAMKLYYAGDKYAIEKLKMLCSSFFIQNLCTSNAIDLLMLADTHNDFRLKKFVEDFIMEYHLEVFCSDEWNKLVEKNYHLATTTMHLKFKRQKLDK